MLTPQQQDELLKARRLRGAATQVERAAPAGEDRTTVLAILDRLATAIERLDTMGVCRRCGRTFIYSAAWFRLHGFTPPRHCDTCRAARRRERRRAGVRSPVPRDAD